MSDIKSMISSVHADKDGLSSCQNWMEIKLQCSREEINKALLIAWKVGEVFYMKKKGMGKKLWKFWLEGSLNNEDRDALYRYMRLSKKVNSPDLLTDLSLRQAYLWLGVPMTPHALSSKKIFPKIPDYIVKSRKLIVEIEKAKRVNSISVKKNLSFFKKRFDILFDEND